MQQRWWREVGEEPSLWAKFGLWHFHLPDSHFTDKYEAELHEVLTLRRFQALEFLHLETAPRKGSASLLTFTSMF